LQSISNTVFNQIEFGLRCLFEDVVHHFAGVTGMADTQAQPGEIPTVTQTFDDVPKSVVAAVTAAQLQSGDSGGEVQLIVGDQYLGWFNIVKPGDGRNGLAASIHVGGGDEQATFPAIENDFTAEAKKFFFFFEEATLPGRQF
jgi:hypothetical protein